MTYEMSLITDSEIFIVCQLMLFFKFLNKWFDFTVMRYTR